MRRRGIEPLPALKFPHNNDLIRLVPTSVDRIKSTIALLLEEKKWLRWGKKLFPFEVSDYALAGNRTPSPPLYFRRYLSSILSAYHTPPVLHDSCSYNTLCAVSQTIRTFIIRVEKKTKLLTTYAPAGNRTPVRRYTAAPVIFYRRMYHTPPDIDISVGGGPNGAAAGVSGMKERIQNAGAVAQAGFPTISDADLDFMLRPYFRTEKELAATKRQFLLNAERSVPTGEIPMLGRKPNDDGQPTLKLMDIPDDSLTVRFFRGGFPAERGMVSLTSFTNGTINRSNLGENVSPFWKTSVFAFVFNLTFFLKFFGRDFVAFHPCKKETRAIAMHQRGIEPRSAVEFDMLW
ncbi:hypothetical protein B0H19DRAFT_1060541 [Mycena capillaripes]|nr:hypothetical protein B0H19DRAFT_1060541 [Mycena capillaripes]